MKKNPLVDYVNKVENSYYVVCWGAVRSTDVTLHFARSLWTALFKKKHKPRKETVHSI